MSERAKPEARSARVPADNPNGGFTLLECMAALVILSTSAIIGLSMIENRQQAVASHGLGKIAPHVLNRELELVRAIPYAHLESRALAPSAADSRFWVSWAVTGRDADAAHVDVTVQWSVDGRTGHHTARTLKTRRGP